MQMGKMLNIINSESQFLPATKTNKKLLLSFIEINYNRYFTCDKKIIINNKIYFLGFFIKV